MINHPNGGRKLAAVWCEQVKDQLGGGVHGDAVRNVGPEQLFREFEDIRHKQVSREDERLREAKKMSAMRVEFCPQEHYNDPTIEKYWDFEMVEVDKSKGQAHLYVFKDEDDEEDENEPGVWKTDGGDGAKKVMILPEGDTYVGRVAPYVVFVSDEEYYGMATPGCPVGVCHFNRQREDKSTR